MFFHQSLAAVLLAAMSTAKPWANFQSRPAPPRLGTDINEEALKAQPPK